MAGNEAFITDLAELERRYGPVNARSLIKETPRLTPPYRALIEASPFVVLASSGPGGMDCSPRGDERGFVHILDDATLALPDRRGNNRIDTLRNIVVDPRMALLFLIPGAGETLRVNGTARISVEPELLARFAVRGQPPVCVVLISIQSVYFQCARAILRAQLWDPSRDADTSHLPTAGQMIAAADTDAERAAGFDTEAYDRELPARQTATLY
jgi:uncharacterized protein